jgi:hypothetical protein
VIEVLCGRVRSARSGISSEDYRVSEGRRVHIPVVTLQDVVVLQLT